MVQYAVFCKVQGCNSVTKIGDISNMKYRLSTSYKYKIPRFLCNLCVFKDILSGYHYTVERWGSVNCWVPRPVFLPGCLSGATPDSCGSLHLDNVFFLHLSPWTWRHAGCHREKFLGAVVICWRRRTWCPRCAVSPRSWRAEPTEAPGTRCHCSSTVKQPPVHFLGCECKVAVGGKGL